MKKIFYSLLLTGVITVSVHAQFSFMSANQQMIEDAVKDGFFTVRSCYQLQDTTVHPPVNFGWENRSYFGETYSLGVKMRGGYWVFNEAVKPWMYDKKYDDYRTDSRYVPVFAESFYCPARDSVFRALASKDKTADVTVANRVYSVQDSLFQNWGFEADFSPGAKKGWLVWLTTEDTLAKQLAPPFSYTVYRAEFTFENGKDTCAVKKPQDVKCLIGVFLIPENTNIGQITFRIAGFVREEDSRWLLFRPADGKGAPAPATLTPVSGSRGGLTPVVAPAEPEKPAKPEKKEKDRKGRRK